MVLTFGSLDKLSKVWYTKTVIKLNKKMSIYIKTVFVASICAAFAIGGMFTYSAFGAQSLSDAASLSQNNSFTGLQNKFPSGIFIGEQGSGGVTYFNGSIINSTTDDDGNGNPVTFGDDVRIDGKISRGEGASKKVWIDGGLKIDGDIEGLEVSDVDNLQDDLDGKANVSHNHDGRYYTESESNSRYVSKSSPSWDSQSGRISLSAASFMAEDTAASDRVNFNSAGVLYLNGGGGETPRFYAPLQLPDGATITSFTLDFWQNGISETITAKLRRTSFASAGGNTIGEVVSSDQGGIGASVTDTSITAPTIDNDNYAYLIEADFSDANQGVNLRLVGIEVTYTFTEPY